jgi:ABC-type glutathione transport system ATPase component
MTAILEVGRLHIRYGALQAVRGASLVAQAGEVIGIVGESGCGKSTLASALIGLPAPGAQVTGGEIRLHGRNLLALPEEEKRRIRGRHVAMIFQDPMTAFNPVLTLGDQLTDFQYHLSLPSGQTTAG